MKTVEIKAIEEAVKHVKPFKSGLTADGGAVKKSGQLWTTNPAPDFPPSISAKCHTDEPMPVVLVRVNTYDMNGHCIHLAAPVILQAEKAGPEDVVLPGSVLAYRPAIAIGSCFSVLDDSLAECKGRLPKMWFNRLLAFRDYLGGFMNKRPAVVVGPDYIDEKDLRLQFHAELPSRIAYLQEPVLVWAEECGVFSGWCPDVVEERESGPGVVFIPWVKELLSPRDESGLALAADDAGTPARRTSYAIPELSLLLDVCSGHETTDVHFMLFTKRGERALKAGDLSVLCLEDKKRVRIVRGEASVSTDVLKKGFKLVRGKSKSVKLVLAD